MVALMAMLTAAEQGAAGRPDGADRDPARQHPATVEPLAEAIGVSVILITGRDRGKKREELVSRLNSGDTPIVIGTHALLQDETGSKTSRSSSSTNNTASGCINVSHWLEKEQRQTFWS